MRQRKSLELYPLTMCYFIIRTQKCTKLFFNHYLVIYSFCMFGYFNAGKLIRSLLVFLASRLNHTSRIMFIPIIATPKKTKRMI